MSKRSVIVLGGGLGGLSAAIALAAKGYAVTLFEKNRRLGGKLNILEKNGFRFDLGPSIFTLPQYFRTLFERAGKRMEDYVTLEPVTPHWRNFFEDGTVMDLVPEREPMRAELKKLPNFSPTLEEEFERFLAYSKTQFDILDEGYLRRGLDTLFEFLRYYGLFRIGNQIDYRRRMSDAIQALLPSSPHLQEIFQYFIKYVGSSALNAPGYMNLMPTIQFEYGLWYVRGGMIRLADALEALARELKVEIHLNSEVEQILKDGRRVTGVVLLGGAQAKADFVVSNMEVIPTYERLLRESPIFLKKLRKFEPACSGLVIHLGLKRVYPQLAHHNFIYSRHQAENFKAVFDRYELPQDPTLYVVAPTRTDPSQAPPGQDNIKILPHVPYLSSDRPIPISEYHALKERIIRKLERIGLSDLRENILFEDVWTPHDIERRYFSNGGSIYGVVSDWRKNYGFKAPKRSSRYRNLFFTGGSVNPGGGMPMVVLCGQLVADRLAQSDRNR